MPELIIILFCEFLFIEKCGSAPIFPAVYSKSFNVYPPLSNEIPLERVTILFCSKFVFPVFEPLTKYIPSCFHSTSIIV